MAAQYSCSFNSVWPSPTPDKKNLVVLLACLNVISSESCGFNIAQIVNGRSNQSILAAFAYLHDHHESSAIAIPLSHLKAGSKRGHATPFQRDTRYRHAHAFNTIHTRSQPTQGAFGTGPLHCLALQSGRPLHPSCHPALTSAHLTRAAWSQRDTQRWTRGQRDHSCDWPLIKGSSVDDANGVGRRRPHR